MTAFWKERGVYRSQTGVVLAVGPEDRLIRQIRRIRRELCGQPVRNASLLELSNGGGRCPPGGLIEKARGRAAGHYRSWSRGLTKRGSGDQGSRDYRQ